MTDRFLFRGFILLHLGAVVGILHGIAGQGRVSGSRLTVSSRNIKHMQNISVAQCSALLLHHYLLPSVACAFHITKQSDTSTPGAEVPDLLQKHACGKRRIKLNRRRERDKDLFGCYVFGGSFG